VSIVVLLFVGVFFCLFVRRFDFGEAFVNSSLVSVTD